MTKLTCECGYTYELLSKSKCESLRKILVKKSIIEYENRDFTQKEALEILKLTERFYIWVASKIG